MLSTVTATSFVRKMDNGRTTPLLVICEREDGTDVEVVLKLSHKCDRRETALAIEAICAMLARDLELPVPEPFIVDFNSDMIDAKAYNDIYNLARSSCPQGFGSALLPNGYSATFSNFKNPQIDSAAAIFMFDALILNPDRRTTNPNCKSKGDSLAIFDHELSLSTDTIGSSFLTPYPWTPGALSPMGTGPGKHVFYDVLKGKKPNLDKLGKHFQELSDNRLNEYFSALPSSWLNNSATIKSALEYLKAARSEWHLLKQEVERVIHA